MARSGEAGQANTMNPRSGSSPNTVESGHPARWWSPLADGRIVCQLCPRECRLRDGQRGFCFVRRNNGGALELTTYGRSSGFCIDPIEKKPLNHFLPGSRVLSFGTAGCNLGCRFCQNWSISKARDSDRLADAATPAQIAAAARRHGCRCVAFTYNDPVIFAEYAIDVAQACRAAGVRTVAVTAGYMSAAPRVEFYAHMDAANVDLKGFTEAFYRRQCIGSLAPVLETLVYLKRETAVWFEVTTLLIPGENDSEAELERASDWFAANLGPDVPWHFTAFHPDYKLRELPPTPPATLQRARTIARAKGIRYVYTGNVRDRMGGSTWCPQCGACVIERDGYELGRWQLRDGACMACGFAVAGVFGGSPERGGAVRMPMRI